MKIYWHKFDKWFYHENVIQPVQLLNDIIYNIFVIGKKWNINSNNYVQPRGSFAQPAVWRPDTALDLASQWPGTRDEPLSMRGECAICGRGAEFSTGLSATLA